MYTQCEEMTGHRQTSTTVDISRQQKNRATKKHPEKRSGLEMGAAEFKHSWRKMEAGAQDRNWIDKSDLWQCEFVT